MRHNAEKYAQALVRMRQHVGTVTEQVFAPEGETPYRYALLGVKAPHEEAPSAAYGMASVAVDVGGHFFMYVHADECWLQVSVSMDLPAEEKRCRCCDYPASEGDAYCSERCRKDDEADRILEQHKARREP